ncbi:MAG: response regulator [bacterium]|nr:response regulator [bacterium]
MGNFKTLLSNYFFILFCCGFVFFIPPRCYSQTTGLKYIENYDFGLLNPMNWSVLQDKRGVIYVANAGCVFEYDGAFQRIINVPVPGVKVRSIAIDDNGVIWVGGVKDLGYLAPDARGMRHYVSLLPRLEKKYKNFTTVFRINITPNGIYFRTRNLLLRWNPHNEKMDLWQPEPGKSFNASFSCGGRLFIHQRGAGLMEMKEGLLETIAGEETFASARVYMMAEYSPGSRKILIGTRSKGFYIYDGSGAAPFPTEVDEYVKSAQLYHGIRLKSPAAAGEFALATQQGGLVVMDARGKLKQIFNKSTGLQNDVVNYVYEDSQGNLWLALDKDISKIEYASPVSFYNEKFSRLPGRACSILSQAPHKPLLVGTSRGLYTYMPPSPPRRPIPALFRPVPGITGNCRHLLPVGDSVLVASTSGVFHVTADLQSNREVIAIQSYVLHPVTHDPDRVLAGTRTGLVSLRRENGQWVEETRLRNKNKYKTITQSIRTIVEDKKGDLWLGTLANGVLKIASPPPGSPDTQPLKITRYNNSHGLPGGEVRVFWAAGHVIFAAGKRIYRFNPGNNRFSPDFTLGKQFADGTNGIFLLAPDQMKNIWFHSEFRNYRAVPNPGQANPRTPGQTFTIIKQPFLRIPRSQVSVVYPDPSRGGVWLGLPNALTYYSPRARKAYDHDYSALIREVEINGVPIMYDIARGRYHSGLHWQDGVPVVPYKDRNLTFQFAAPCYENEKAITYRCRLEGYDKAWSQWKSETKKVYTNLDSGSYTFRVQAKNVYHHLSREGRFRFRLQPHWSQTWWAFSFYAFSALLLVFLVVKWRSGKLEREKKRLEQTVKQRTREIHRQKQQLEEQTAQLIGQSGQLKEMDRIKSRFFTNISHEFRTPLTLIIGPLEQMLARVGGDEEESQHRMMLRNARRLLRLINQLLDLAKFDSGQMTLKARKQNIISFLKGIHASFEVMARQKKLELSFRAAQEDILLYFDTEKMEIVISNLLVNAMKFTPAGGSIHVTTGGRESFFEISVRDTGTGIPRDRLAHIFDRFYQVERTPETPNPHPLHGNPDMRGTGIGLALTRELVLLHHGFIEVGSSDGRDGKDSGTQFIVRLPIGHGHLTPAEMPGPGTPAGIKGPGTPDGVKGTPAGVKETLFDTPLDLPVFEPSAGMEQTVPNARLELEAGAGTDPGTDEKEIILIVEDNADARQFIRGGLEPFYTVKEAADGNEGLKQAQTLIPDLVVSDVMMPRMDGYQLCRELKKDIKTSHIPVILLTARAAEESIVRGLETGADDYVTKPFSTKILLARIKNLILLRRRWQETIHRQMTLQPTDIQVSSMDQTFIDDVQEVVEKNLSDELFNVDQLAKKLYMGRSTLYRKIQALTGQSPRDFIRSYRLKRGAQLLKANFGNVTEVAFEVGFSSTTYFSKCFKKQFQQLPSGFQRE